MRSASIANGYDQFLQDDPLAVFDWKIVSHCLPVIDAAKNAANDQVHQTVIEFGCGTGRTLIPLVERGYHAIGVDLSLPMLNQMQQNFSDKFDAKVSPSRLTAVQGNLVELDCLASDSVDHGLCLFSTLGMVRGREFRQQFLSHARRVIKDDGLFILHAHNLWQQVKLPGGWKWLAGHLMEVAMGKCDLGDRFAKYRNVSDMFIHSFRKSELEAALKQAGFVVKEWHRVEDQPKSKTPVGWVVVCV